MKLKQITALKDGPIYIQLEGDPPIALCRCSQSDNKPYCDGTHKSCGFVAPVEIVVGEKSEE